MHFAIAVAEAVPGLGTYSAENADELAAKLNADLALRAGTVGLADASIAAVGGGKRYIAGLTYRLGNGAGTPALPSVTGLVALCFEGESETEIEAKRTAAYAAIGFPTTLYLDKTASSSNGRHFVNLQIVGGRPA